MMTKLKFWVGFIFGSIAMVFRRDAIGPCEMPMTKDDVAELAKGFEQLNKGLQELRRELKRQASMTNHN